MELLTNHNQTEEILSHFFELSQDYLCIAGYDGYFRKVNPAFINFIGYSEEELLAMPIRDLVYPADRDRTAETRNEILKGAPLHNFENRYVTKSGEIAWLTWTSIPGESNQLIYAIAKNITHIKKKEEERNTVIANLTSLNKELKQLSYTATHDLKSPVNNLLSLFHLLDTSEIKNEENLLYLDLLKQSSESLRDILNDYVDTITKKSNALSQKELVSLELVLDSTIKPIKYLIQNTKTKFHIDFKDAPLVNFNAFYLHSVFLNLISNSIKYARPGVPPIIHITSTKMADSIHVVITDNGQGFDMEKVKGKMFELNETFHDQADSKGVGLYLVNDYMKAFHGKVTAVSSVNNGATFTLIFPL